jgi:hypothetical protein
MESPDIYVLSKIHWQIFGSLSYKSERLPERVRLSIYFAMLRETAKDFKIYFPSLPWCLRLERGEITLRLHNHFLLAGLPDHAVNEKTCFAMMKRWESKGGGIPRIRLFNPQLGGVDYVAKCLGYDLDGGDAYESAKFGSNGCELMYSQAVWDERNHFRRRTIC